MPKDFTLESIRHLVLRALERARLAAPEEDRRTWGEISESLDFTRKESAALVAVWTRPRPGTLSVSARRFVLYQRGDASAKPATDDPASLNARAADQVVAEIAALVGVAAPNFSDPRLLSEETFHNVWASGVRSDEVLVRESFEVVTAPENRLVRQLFGDLRGRRALDLGCGLGEGAVYFALQGAQVTACDLSPGMLEVTSRVAALHGVQVSLHRAPAEETGLPADSFDLVYAANLLHHVDVPRTLDEIRRVLAPGGMFASWDPLAHNPLINVYRRMARAVRTADEHPLRMGDMELFRGRFREVHWRCHWLFAQAVFLRFYLWERVHPGKERYWKKILTDADRLAAFYGPLERLDRRLMESFPWLGRYCWNIVVWGWK